MNKEKFVKYIKALQTANELQDKIGKLMEEAEENIQNDFMNGAGLMINHENIVIELLEEIMGDKYDIISWWIYEGDYGKSDEANLNIYDAETEEIICTIDTPEKLYDYIKENRGMEE